jgi:hypothetical protein
LMELRYSWNHLSTSSSTSGRCRSQKIRATLKRNRRRAGSVSDWIIAQSPFGRKDSSAVAAWVAPLVAASDADYSAAAPRLHLWQQFVPTGCRRQGRPGFADADLVPQAKLKRRRARHGQHSIGMDQNGISSPATAAAISASWSAASFILLVASAVSCQACICSPTARISCHFVSTATMSSTSLLSKMVIR